METALKKKEFADNELKGLKSVSYRVSGGMSGGRLELEINKDKVKKTELEHHGAEEKVVTVPTKQEYFDYLNDYFKKVNYKEWKNLKNSEFFADDEPTKSVSIRFEDNTFYSVNSNKKLPEQNENLFREIKDYLNKITESKEN